MLNGSQCANAAMLNTCRTMRNRVTNGSAAQQSPGGLVGHVAVKNFWFSHSTRNCRSKVAAEGQPVVA